MSGFSFGDGYKSLPLFLGGIFLAYIAILDETLFDLILYNSDQSRIAVTIATTVAAALPMFFAIGYIKQSVLHRWQAIYQYERLLEKDVFWIMTIVLIGFIIYAKIEEGVHITSMLVMIGGVAFSVYLIIRRVTDR
ncbi:MAG: hypothetical protein MPL62_02405 [Alphaproteobacteria bacterium]|nr:hypothetical protein [Alphaproteobacteria bacterium]